MVRLLREEAIVSLSDYGPRRMAGRKGVPFGLTLAQAKQVVDAATASRDLRVASIRGSMLANEADQTALLAYVADKLPGSRIVCLNVGEFYLAREAAYERLVDRLPLTYVGNLYWHDPSPVRAELKARAQEALRGNRKKDFYRAQLLSEPVWEVLRHGCKAWWNPQETTRGNLEELWARTEPTERCTRRCVLRRCKGLNRRDERCCLCTRHESGYCWRHQ